MSTYESLQRIKAAWYDKSLPLGEKIKTISSVFSGSGLDFSGTAAYLRVTPSELDAMLALSDLDDEAIDEISRVNPPKTTWIMLASASDNELKGALDALERNSSAAPTERVKSSIAEYVYTTMMEVTGPTVEQKVAELSGDDLLHALKKGSEFNALTTWDAKFLNSISSQKKRGKVLTGKQAEQLVRILGNLVDAGAIKRDSIDGDTEICCRILDALGR